MMAIEKELREYLIYTGQMDFYEDMLKERRTIRLARAAAAKAAAERKAMIIDIAAVAFGILSVVGIGVAMFAII